MALRSDIRGDIFSFLFFKSAKRFFPVDNARRIFSAMRKPRKLKVLGKRGELSFPGISIKEQLLFPGI